MTELSRNQFYEAMLAFLEAQTWDESKRVIETHCDQLFTDDTDQYLASLLERYKGDANGTYFLEERRDLLMRCRRNGIEGAFADVEELRTLLSEIDHLMSPGDMSRRVMLCRTALQLVNRETQPRLWADLQDQLAMSLARNPQGEHAENMEQTIFHYEQALDVYTSQAFPERWAATQLNLAAAYSGRIRGERADNLEQAILHCQHALDTYTRQAFPEQWAATQHILANAYQERIRGERADNLEQAIYHFKQALQILTRHAFPEDWAMVHHNLANIYQERIRGEHSDNLEQAILHSLQALGVYKRQAFPERWATIQHNLGIVYQERIRGERANNLEQAILHFEQALDVYRSQAFPEQWAATQLNLAKAYLLRICGERADNLEQTIHHYQLALEVLTRQAFPHDWAITQNILGTAYWIRIRGERADNLEQAIYHFEQALQVQTRQDFPEQWAIIQNNLANAYQERIRGERDDNLEQAILHCQHALKVRTRQDFPEQWAETQHNLAKVYSERIRGERADNLEQAILHNQQALQVYTCQSFPEQWAMAQHNLANAYRMRIRGERADNLEQAIYHFEQALQVFTRQAFPKQWAMIQDSLGNVYRERIRGERADNLEQAISHCEQALEVHTRQAFPEQWAATQNNLAITYRERIRGERDDNLEQAVLHLKQAIEVFTRQAFPEQWAATQLNLAAAYSGRIRGERADNLEQAISHCEQALEVHTRQAFPEQWAATQLSLANVYCERIRGERADNLEQAIRLYKQVLDVYTRQALPERWATTQHNLSHAYFVRIRGERGDNLEQAILHLKQALDVRTPMNFPQDCQYTAYWLGRLLYDKGRFSEARYALDTAHQAVEALRGDARRDVAKRSLAQENADLYAHLVSCCLKEGDAMAAFVYAVAGKGRAFVDLLATARVDLLAASTNDPTLADDLHRARQLRQQVDALLAALTGESDWSTMGSSSTTGIETPDRTPLSPDTLRVQLRSLQAQETSHWDEMAYKYPALTATQQAPVLSVDQARTLAAELNATLVEYYRHTEGWCAFVVTPNAMHYIPLPLIDHNLVVRMLTWMLRLEYPVGRNRLSDLRLSEWHDAVIAPLKEYLPQGRPIVLAPFDVLHVLPLAAALNPQTGHYLAEDYQIAFAPSLSALCIAWDQAHHTGNDRQGVPHHLLNVAYPGTPGSDHYLPNVLPEAEAIARHFPQVTPLYQEEATPEAVLAQSHDQDVVHFGCHGWFDVEQPEQSGLMLAGGWLTVQRIITELRLERVQLATLGACLSGRAALKGGDKHVGLLQAMLTTGVKAVVASLWPVDDATTRAMFETFYAELAAGRSPAKAMQEAAHFVRVQPGWAHPFYWAAFQVSGLAHTRIESA